LSVIVDCGGGQWRWQERDLCHFATAIIDDDRMVAGGRPLVAAADTATTTPLLLPPLSPSLQPLPTCQWLIVVSSVAPRLLRCPPSKVVSLRCRVIVDAFFHWAAIPFC
jgi:hypothetical protein